jgi:hypothetical protein
MDDISEDRSLEQQHQSSDPSVSPPQVHLLWPSMQLMVSLTADILDAQLCKVESLQSVLDPQSLP